MIDGGAKVVLTADGTWRGTKLLNLKEIVDDAMLICRQKELVVTSCVVVNHLGILDEKQKVRRRREADDCRLFFIYFLPFGLSFDIQ